MQRPPALARDVGEWPVRASTHSMQKLPALARDVGEWPVRASTHSMQKLPALARDVGEWPVRASTHSMQKLPPGSSIGEAHASQGMPLPQLLLGALASRQRIGCWTAQWLRPGPARAHGRAACGEGSLS